MVEHDLSVKPLVAHHGIPQARQNELAVRVDDLCVRGICNLSCHANIGDSIALDDDRRVTKR